MKKEYGLSFISDEQLFQHVKETVDKYRFKINLKEFNKNLIDPIKLTFNSKIYGKTIEDIIESESIRQMDKSDTNHIGYFHQNIFKYFDGWIVPEQGYDVINEANNIYVEMKNKHNTMNSVKERKTYMKMQDKILQESNATCYLVEILAPKNQDIPWEVDEMLTVSNFLLKIYEEYLLINFINGLLEKMMLLMNFVRPYHE